MKQIDLKKIIDENDLNKKEIAQQLFPGNKYPALALNRVIAGEAKLDSDQISKLALITNLTIGDLYGIKFSAKSRDKKMFFEFEDFKAELCLKTWSTKVFHKESLFHEEVLHKSSIALSDYLDELTNIINKFKNNEQSN